MGSLAFPIVAAALFAGITAGGLQTGFRLTPKVLEFKWERLNPVSGFQRVVSKEVFVRLGIDLLKPGAIGAVLWAAISRILDDPIFNGLAVSLIFGILVSTLLTLVVIPLLYYVAYRRKTPELLPAAAAAST